MRTRLMALALLGAVSAISGCDDKGKAAPGGDSGAAASPGSSAKKEPKTPPSAASSTAGTAPTPPPPAKQSLADIQKDGAKQVLESWNSHDAKRVAALYSENAILHNGVTNVPGRDKIEQHIADAMPIASDSKITVTRVLWGGLQGKEFFAEFVFAGKNDGDAHAHGHEMKATGKQFAVKGASHISFDDDGLITDHWMFIDHGTMGSQLGLSKEMPAAPLAAVPTGAVEIHAAKAGDEAQEKNREALHKFYEAMNAGKIDDALALATDDTVSWENFMGGTEKKGKKEIKDSEALWMKAFTNQKDERITTVATDGDLAAARVHWTGTFSAPLKLGNMPKEIPPTNRRVSLSAIVFYQLKEGKIAHTWLYGEGMELMSQLGVEHEHHHEGEAAPAPSGSAPAAPAPSKK